MDVVSGRGDRQNAADRLDPVDVPMIVDERLHGFDRRSSSAVAKYADALRRISLAWRSSRFSRSSALIRSPSCVVGPARRPWSRSDRRTQLRSVSPVQPILLAIELIAAHCDGCSAWWSNTMRTARSRPSAENLFVVGLLIAPSSQDVEPPANPVRFNLLDRLAFDKAFPPDPGDRLHNQHPPATRSNPERVSLHITAQRGSKLDADHPSTGVNLPRRNTLVPWIGPLAARSGGQMGGRALPEPGKPPALHNQPRWPRPP